MPCHHTVITPSRWIYECAVTVHDQPLDLLKQKHRPAPDFATHLCGDGSNPSDLRQTHTTGTSTCPCRKQTHTIHQIMASTMHSHARLTRPFLCSIEQAIQTRSRMNWNGSLTRSSFASSRSMSFSASSNEPLQVENNNAHIFCGIRRCAMQYLITVFLTGAFGHEFLKNHQSPIVVSSTGRKSSLGLLPRTNG